MTDPTAERLAADYVPLSYQDPPRIHFLAGYRAAIEAVLADLEDGIETLSPGFAEELSYAAERIRATFAKST